MSVRNFTPGDLPALLAFADMVQSGGEDTGQELRRQTFRQVLEQPGLDPEHNCFLLQDDSQLQGYCLLFWEPLIKRAVLGPDVSPEAAGGPLERELVRHAVGRARELKASVAHLCLAEDSPRYKLLEDEGFSRIRVYWDMSWNQESVPPAEPPEGFTIRSFQPGDAPALTEIQNAAFTGSWGFSPNTVDEIEYRSGMVNTAHKGIVLLHHGTDLAGYCWTCISPSGNDTKGVIGMIGIAPAYRGQGVSKPILLAGMEYLRSAGVNDIGLHVDGSNTPAIRLYKSVGFEKVGELHWYELKL